MSKAAFTAAPPADVLVRPGDRPVRLAQTLALCFAGGADTFVSCRPFPGWPADLCTVVLYLAGQGGARVERLPSEAVFVRPRWGNLRTGWWTVSADGLDARGNMGWRAPEVRFQLDSKAETQVELAFFARPGKD